MQLSEALIADRRGFMLGAGAVLFAKPKLLLSKLPLLWGDGIHDDTEGLQALLSGLPIRAAESQDTFRPLLSGGWAALKGGKYLIGGTLKPTVPFLLTRGEYIQANYGVDMFDLKSRPESLSGQTWAHFTHNLYVLTPRPGVDHFMDPAFPHLYDFGRDNSVLEHVTYDLTPASADRAAA